MPRWSSKEAVAVTEDPAGSIFAVDCAARKRPTIPKSFVGGSPPPGASVQIGSSSLGGCVRPHGFERVQRHPSKSMVPSAVLATPWQFSAVHVMSPHGAMHIALRRILGVVVLQSQETGTGQLVMGSPVPVANCALICAR